MRGAHVERTESHSRQGSKVTHIGDADIEKREPHVAQRGKVCNLTQSAVQVFQRQTFEWREVREIPLSAGGSVTEKAFQSAKRLHGGDVVQIIRLEFKARDEPVFNLWLELRLKVGIELLQSQGNRRDL